MPFQNNEPDYKKELEDFTYIISHDLNAPFRHIREFSKLLQKKISDRITDEEQEYLDYIGIAVNSIEGMLDTLLEYSRLNTEIEKFDWINPDLVFDEILLEEELLIKSTKAQINKQELPQKIRVKPTQFKKLMKHLLKNALTFHGIGAQPIITIEYSTYEKMHKFTITDNGLGIPESKINDVFKIFRKAHFGERFTGMGAGLSICEKIIRDHSGHISIESKPEEFTKVTVKIPIIEPVHSGQPPHS